MENFNDYDEKSLDLASILSSKNKMLKICRITDSFLIFENKLKSPITIRDYVKVKNDYYVLSELSSINKVGEDNNIVRIFDSRNTYIANMEYFPNYKDGENIFLLLNMNIMVINLQGQKKEFIKYTFCDIMVYPNDIILGVDGVNNIMILNPTRYSVKYNENVESNPEQYSHFIENSIIDSDEFEASISLNKAFKTNEDVRLVDISEYNSDLMVIYSHNKLTLVNINNQLINEIRELKDLDDVIYCQRKLICATYDEILIYCISDMINPILIKGSFYVNNLSNVYPGMMLLNSRTDQNYLSIYNLKDNKMKLRFIKNDSEVIEPLYVKTIACDNTLKIGIIDKDWKLRILKFNIK